MSCKDANLLETDGKTEYQIDKGDPNNPQFTIDKDKLDFGVVHNPYKNLTKSFKLTNLIETQSFKFEIDKLVFNISDIIIAPYSSDYVDITLAARNPGIYNGDLNIIGKEKKFINLKAIIPHISAKNYDFGNIKINDSQVKEIEFINNSKYDIEISEIMTNNNQSIFSVIDTEKIIIPSYERIYLKIQLTPFKIGTYEANIRYKTSETNHILNFATLSVDIYE